MDTLQGRLLISSMLLWCGEFPVLEGREELRTGGSRDG